MSVTLYGILEIYEDATPEEIKAAYRRLSKLHHPDVGGNSDLFILINEAYEILSNEESRNFYKATGLKSRDGHIDFTRQAKARVMSILEQWIDAKVNSMVSGNQIKPIETYLVEVLSEASSNISNNMKQVALMITNYRAAADKIIFDGEEGAENLVLFIINSKIKDLERQYNSLKEQDFVVEICFDFAEKYSSKPETMMAHFGGYQSGTTFSYVRY